MGSPKALLRYRAESFLDTLIGIFSTRTEPVIAVLGANADEIRAHTARSASYVVNSEYRRGQTSSMQCGLRAVPPEADGVLFTLVDHPAVSPTTIDALLAGRDTLLRVPCYKGERGHPIWFSRELIAEFLALPADGAAREIVRAHTAETAFLDVDDVGILADIDDAVAYAHLIGAAR
jgi:molybdenum cofactor cytidylyltransferase